MQYADRMEVYLDESGDRILRTVSTGNIKIVTKDCRFGTAVRAEYFEPQKLARLIGNARVWQEDNVVTGDTIDFYISEDRRWCKLAGAREGSSSRGAGGCRRAAPALPAGPCPSGDGGLVAQAGSGSNVVVVDEGRRHLMGGLVFPWSARQDHVVLHDGRTLLRIVGASFSRARRSPPAHVPALPAGTGYLPRSLGPQLTVEQNLLAIWNTDVPGRARARPASSPSQSDGATSSRPPCRAGAAAPEITCPGMVPQYLMLDGP
jgi:hypothetical protein